LLSGESPAAVGVRYLPTPTQKFDARQLERWGIPRDRLPAGSQVLFEPVSLWHEYRGRIALLALLLVAQTAIIVGLFDALRLRRRAEAISLSTEVRASAVLDALHERVVVLDRQGVITSANRSWDDFAHSFGRQDLGVGTNFVEACRLAAERGNRDAWRTLDGILAVLEGRRKRFELHYTAQPTENGRWSALTAVPLAHHEAGAVISIADISERRQLEVLMQQQRAEIAHIGRVATLGELSAAIAHELNQPLAGILTNAQAAQRLLAADEAELDTVSEALDDIVADGRRAGEVIRRLRNLLRKGPLDLVPLDVNEVVEQVVHLTANDVLLRGATIDLELTPGLAPVAADRVQLQQVLINLILNGLDAMVETPRERRHLLVRTAAAAGELVIELRDNGSGIHGELLSKLFEPFQTTKPDGMGIGLSIVRTVVEGHGGTVAAVNNPAGGATFTVALPVAEVTA
jgi:C4-dicarboxylate-specific signal transduction histidine kinase